MAHRSRRDLHTVLRRVADLITARAIAQYARSSAFQLVGEELQRACRLRRLLAGKVDAAVAQVGPSSRPTTWNASLGSTLRRQFENPRSVGVQPELDGHLPPEVLRRELELQHIERTEDGELVELETGWRMSRVEVALAGGEEFADRALAERGGAHVVLAQLGLERCRADEATRHGVDLDAEIGQRA